MNNRIICMQKKIKNSLSLLMSIILLVSLFSGVSKPIKTEAKTVTYLEAGNDGSNYYKTFYGHYGGALDGTWSGTADGGYRTSNGGYYEADNRYLDSGRVSNFTSNHVLFVDFAGYAGSYNLYVGDANGRWYYVGSKSLSSYTWDTFVYYWNQLPIQNIRYFRVEKATASSHALDHIRLFVRRTDDAPPIYSSYSITNVTESGYDIYVYGVSDAVSGVRNVSVPTWTEANGQDDIQWYPATNKGGGTWHVRVNRSNHKNEYGKYNSHIYLYDHYDNVVAVGASTTVPDTTKPNISVSASPTSWTNGNVTLTATASDNSGGSGFSKIKLPNGNFTTASSTTYGVANNGTYTFTAYDKFDNATAKSITVSNIDKTAPTLTLNQNVSGYTKGNITITATGTDVGSGVKRIKNPAGSWVTGSSATYAVASNGTYTFSIEDNVGNVSNKSITVSNIDKVNPTVNLSKNPTGWTKGNVTISATTSDNLSGVNTITKPDNTTVSGTSTTYAVAVNGTFSFKATDNAGNIGSNSISITNIDKSNPTATLTPNITAWTKDNVTISVSSSDSQSGVKQIKYPNGSVVAGSTGTYAVNANGTYNFEITDNVGNVLVKPISISNIDKTAPGLTLSHNPTATTSGNVVITATGSDSQSGVKRILTPSGTWVNGNTATFTATGNGSFNFTVEDNVGNSYTKTISVNNIDKTAPSITLTQNPTTWTNGNVTLTLNATDNLSGVSTIKKPDGTTVSGSSTTFEVSNNGTYTFEVTDSVGNKGTQSIAVGNIDKTPPSIVLTQNPATWTSGSVSIAVQGNDSQSGIKQIKYPNGSVVAGNTGTYAVNANGIYIFEVTDNANNTFSQSITVSNIDKIAPALSLSQNPATNTSGNVVITATGSDSQSGVKRILTPAGTWVNGNTATYTATVNGNYNFTVEDNLGNSYSKSISIGNIDKTAPSITLTQTPTTWTNGDVTLTLNATDNLSGVSTIKKPDGTIVSGSTTTFTVPNNGTYTFEVTDSVGNKSTESIVVRNIDKTKPIVSVTQNPSTWTAGNISLIVKGTDSESGIKQIKLPNGNVVNSDTGTYVASSNGAYSFEVTDNANNVNIQTVTVSNIDRAGAVLTLTQSPSSWTKQDVVITATSVDSQSGVKEIKLPSGNIITGNSATYSVNTNGIYNFETTDNAGNKSSKSIEIQNIDKEMPTVTLTASTDRITNQQVIITVNAYDRLSGMKSIKLPNGTVVNGSSATYPVTKNGVYSFEIEDLVGNKSISSISIENIIEIVPISGINRIEYKLQGAVNKDWTTYTGTFNIGAEGITTITARAIDKAGNISNEAISFVKIDRSKPINGTVEIIVR